MLPEENLWLKSAKKTGTDKITSHNYETMYGRLFELPPGRRNIRKMLEIGLGCNMNYGPGASAHIWRDYFPNTDIWMAEYDAACVAKHKKTLEGLNINVLTGDQADIPTLKEWIEHSGGEFDMVIDDGGHTNMQMFNTFMVLFQQALKPGGIFIMEDLFVARTKWYTDGDKDHIMIEVVKDWIEGIVMDPGGFDFVLKDIGDKPYKPRWGLPPNLKSIECMQHACIFYKCYTNDVDPRCRSEYTDDSQGPRQRRSGRRALE